MNDITLKQIKYGIIKPSLEKIGLFSDAALNLVTGTGLVETGYKTVTQYNGGPALGWFQMEPFTYNDCFVNFLDYRKSLRNLTVSILKLHDSNKIPDVSYLKTNQNYAAALCRIKYLRVPESISENNAEYLCDYWKKNYNTEMGKGNTDETHINIFQKAIDT